jgi:putative sterol carrier protein
VRERHAGAGEPIAQAIRINLIVNDTPFADGSVQSYLDTSSGQTVLELGQLDEPDVTVTTDYETAKAIFATQDPAAGMQAFMAGKVVVQGDMMRLMMLPALLAANPQAEQISAEIRDLTE